MIIKAYSIFYNDFKISHLPENIIPVYAGSFSKNKPSHLNDNGYIDNSRYGELSFIYKIWKDKDYSDIVLFCHYRRFFNFNKNVFINETSKDLLNYNTFDEKKILNLLDNYDFIFPDHGILNTPEVVNYIENHNYYDYFKMIINITEKYPECYDSVKQHLLGKHNNYGFMMITTWNNFNRFCEFLFSNLFELEKEINKKSDNYQIRDLAFIGERISDIYLRNFKIKRIPFVKVTG
jgi:hypothetical protein